MEYTKGEWKAHKNALGTWTVATDLESIAQVERHFNAQLIASAPDLYEALIRAMGLLELAEQSPHKVKWGTKYDCLTPPETIGELKQVLAKAEVK